MTLEEKRMQHTGWLQLLGLGIFSWLHTMLKSRTSECTELFSIFERLSLSLQFFTCSLGAYCEKLSYGENKKDAFRNKVEMEYLCFGM